MGQIAGFPVTNTVPVAFQKAQAVSVQGRVPFHKEVFCETRVKSQSSVAVVIVLVFTSAFFGSNVHPTSSKLTAEACQNTLQSLGIPVCCGEAVKLELIVGNMVGVHAVGGGMVALVLVVYQSNLEDDCGLIPTQTNQPLNRPEQSFPIKGFHSKLSSRLVRVSSDYILVRLKKLTTWEAIYILRIGSQYSGMCLLASHNASCYNMVAGPVAFSWEAMPWALSSV